MASYRGHLTTSVGLGIAYTAVSIFQLNVDWPIAAVGGILTALGGLLPDLDSDSGVPVRELSHLIATVAPLALLRRISGLGWSHEQAFLAAAGVYVFVRYILFSMFRKITVHRGMYHSIPAMLIAGLATFLVWEHPSVEVRAFLAVGTMLGFLSHLVLDELCSVDLNGVIPKLNHFSGTAVKFYSPSMSATAFTYLILCGMGYTAYTEVQHNPGHPMIAQAGPVEPKPAKRSVLDFQPRNEAKDQLRWRPTTPSTRPEGGIKLSVPPPKP